MLPIVEQRLCLAQSLIACLSDGLVAPSRSAEEAHASSFASSVAPILSVATPPFAWVSVRSFSITHLLRGVGLMDVVEADEAASPGKKVESERGHAISVLAAATRRIEWRRENARPSSSLSFTFFSLIPHHQDVGR